MNLTRHRLCSRSTILLRQPHIGAWVSTCALAVLCSCLFLAVAEAQENPGLNPTNGLLASNDLHQTKALIDSSRLAPTNESLSTNTAAPLNAGAFTNALAATNIIGSTNTLSESKALPTTQAVATNEPARERTPITETTNSPHTSSYSPSATPPRMPGSVTRDYASFGLIAERNIFNPNRSRHSPYARSEYRRPVRTEAFSLIGTMSYEKGLFAFFDGTSSDFRKSAKPNDEIAGYKITEIAYNKVKLAINTNEIELLIGMQMRREDEGDWMLRPQTESYESPSAGSSVSSTPSFSSRSGRESRESREPSSFSSSTPAATGTPASTAATNTTKSATESSAGGGESDILKKLMQRREQELNK